MPDLPTITVTAEQAQRLLAIFGDAEGYRKWLRQTLKAHVIETETHRVDVEARRQRQQEIDALITDLFGDETP